MAKIKRVKQDHETGCGIACVATLVGTKYNDVFKKAKHLFGWNENDDGFYTKGKDLRNLLLEFNIKSERGRRIGSWKALIEKCPVAIVAINPDGKYWHWVVFVKTSDDCVVLDPRSKREIRRDFKRMKIRSYIPIHI